VASTAALRHLAILSEHSFSDPWLTIPIGGYKSTMVDYSANYATATKDQTRTLFSHVMLLVAAAT
jgi:hypothetical protein